MINPAPKRKRAPGGGRKPISPTGEKLDRILKVRLTKAQLEFLGERPGERIREMIEMVKEDRA